MRIALMMMVLLAAPAAAQQPAGCTAAEHREFDFWVGTWRVVGQDGRELGRNQIEAVEAGCALQENWRGASGHTGRSLNWREDGKWHQLWIDRTPTGVLHLSGGRDGGTMLMTGVTKDQQGRAVQNRVRWSPLPAGGLRQHWETSLDGKTWQTVFDGVYVKG